jgi:hypothetical protein
MTTKSEHTIEYFGNASPGWGKPYRRVDIDRVGSNTNRETLAAGKYTENPFTATGVIVINRQISWREPPGMQIRFMGSRSFGSWPVFDSVAVPSFSDVTPKLLEKWRASSFNLGVSVGEGRESVEMITDRMADIVKAARALRRRNLGDALRHLAHVPKGGRRSAQVALSLGSFRDAWLELQYGWIPLIKDISKAAEMVKLKPTQNRIKARSSNRGGAVPYGGGIPQSRIKVFANDQRLQQVVVVTHQPSMLERLGLTDAQSIGWELAPLSFVADWFSPIGDYLASLHAVNTMPVTNCIQTYSSKRDAVCYVNTGDNFYGGPIVAGSATGQKEFSVSRGIYASLPLAWLASAQTPSNIESKYEPSLMRLANGAALASKVLHGLAR